MNKMPHLQSYQPTKKLTSEKTYSLSYIRSLNSKLQVEKQQSKLIHEKMKQQISLSTKIGAYVGESILKVENDGAFYASKLQEQKRKHKALVSLVQHYQERIEREKLNNHMEMMKTRVIGKIKDKKTESKRNYSQIKSTRFTEGETSRNHELQEILRGLNELQKSYQQFVLKNNSCQYELSKKLAEVRTLRSERTIFNKMFDQFEKQLFHHEFQYKELAIQKSILESEFEEKVKIYQSLNLNACKQFSKLMKSKKKKLATDRLLEKFSTFLETNKCGRSDISDYFRQQQKEDTQQIKCKRGAQLNKSQQNYKNVLLENSFLKFPTIEEAIESFRPMKQKKGYQHTESSNNSDKIQSEKGRSKAQISYLEIEQQKVEQSKKDGFEYERKIKDLFEEFGVCRSEDVPGVVENLDKEIEKLYRISQELYEQVYQRERFLYNYLERKKKSGKVLLNKGLEMVTPRDNQNLAMQEQINKKQFLRFQIQEADLQYLAIDQQIKRFCHQELHKIQRLQLGAFSQEKDYHSNHQDNFQKILETQILLANILNNDRGLIEICAASRSNEIKGSNEKFVQKKKKFSRHNKQQHRKESSNANSTMNQLQEGQQNNFLSKQVKKIKRGIERVENNVEIEDLHISRLEQLLKENRVTHNNSTIFTEEELIEISRRKINQSKKVDNCSEGIKSQFVIAETKSYEQITSSKNRFSGIKMMNE